MEYDQLRLEIENSLKYNGFIKDEGKDFLSLIREQQQVVVVDGIQQSVTKKVNVVLECLGEGAINDTPTVGYKLLINNRDLGDFWLSCANDLIAFKLI